MTDRERKNLEDELKVKDFKLNSLLDITNSISLNENISTIIRIFEFILHEQLGLEKICFVQQTRRMGMFAKSWVQTQNEGDKHSEGIREI